MQHDQKDQLKGNFNTLLYTHRDHVGLRTSQLNCLVVIICFLFQNIITMVYSFENVHLIFRKV